MDTRGGYDTTRRCGATNLCTPLAAPSVGRIGVCWDNAAAEAFFAALKNEMYHHQHSATRARARFAVADYIEVFYNRIRLHSTLGYRTPAEALTEFTTQPRAT